MFATVCALLIILAGAVCIPNLPIAMYPTLAPPQVNVVCNYVGANADTVEKAVTIPLEEAINGVEGMRYIRSSSTNNGTSQITATFQTGYSLDIAAVDVQNRVASVTGALARRGERNRHLASARPIPILCLARDSLRATAGIPTSSFRITWMFMLRTL